MSAPPGTERPCFICGDGIARDDFLEWPGTPRHRYATCGRCGAPNDLDDTAFVVLDMSQSPELPTPVMDVVPVGGGGWRAGCDCGLTEAVATQAQGWLWIVDHRCMSQPRRQT
jgi:hypothetical protein